MSRAIEFLFRRKGGKGWHWTDIVTWVWLIVGLFVMFGPAVWLTASSFKSPAALAEFPPTILPYVTQKVTVEGYDKPLDLYTATLEDGSTATLAEVRRIGTVSQMVDPEKPAEIVKVNIAKRTPVRQMSFATENYTEPFTHFDFVRYLWNSVFVTVTATLITLVVNSMAAFALSKYEFRGRTFAMLLILATLMVPLSVIMVPLYSIVSALGLFNNLWGVILPTVATPTGVFILRQYMLTIPDELLDAARMDKASEWQIYWRIILPLTAPALAVLARRIRRLRRPVRLWQVHAAAADRRP
jgi:alpha-1,4-digalacturonate transport system permease protein